MRHKAYTVI